MKTYLVVSSAILHAFASAAGNGYQTDAAEILAQAESECTRFEDGEFHATEQAITSQDVTGDGRPETIVDASHFSCSTSASMWNGSGGTYLWVLVDGTKHEFLAHRWKVVDVDGQKVLLLAVHSSECGDTIGPCYRALVWSDGFRTTRRK